MFVSIQGTDKVFQHLCVFAYGRSSEKVCKMSFDSIGRHKVSHWYALECDNQDDFQHWKYVDKRCTWTDVLSQELQLYFCYTGNTVDAEPADLNGQITVHKSGMDIQMVFPQCVSGCGQQGGWSQQRICRSGHNDTASPLYENGCVALGDWTVQTFCGSVHNGMASPHYACVGGQSTGRHEWMTWSTLHMRGALLQSGSLCGGSGH